MDLGLGGQEKGHGRPAASQTPRLRGACRECREGTGRGDPRPVVAAGRSVISGAAPRLNRAAHARLCSGTTRGSWGREGFPARQHQGWPCRPLGRLRVGSERARRHAGSGAGEGNPVQPLIPLPVLVALVSRGLLAEALRVDEDEEDEG